MLVFTIFHVPAVSFSKTEILMWVFGPIFQAKCQQEVNFQGISEAFPTVML